MNEQLRERLQNYTEHGYLRKIDVWFDEYYVASKVCGAIPTERELARLEIAKDGLESEIKKATLRSLFTIDELELLIDLTVNDEEFEHILEKVKDLYELARGDSND